MRRIVLIFVLLIALVSLIQPTLAQTPPLPGDFMGMVVRDPHYEWNTNPAYPNDVNRVFYDAMGENLQTLGVKYVRIEMRAEDGADFNPSEPVRFSNYDYFINEVAPRHGLKVIVLLATNIVRNPFYIDPEEIEAGADRKIDGVECRKHAYGCGTNEYMRLWLDRAFAIADRYGDKVAAYEVMNEENRYINGDGKGISPLKMATLMAKFYRVFKVTGPASPSGGFLGVPGWRSYVKVILGGMHPDRCNDCGSSGMNDREYLGALYTSAPFQEFRTNYHRYPLDGVGYHPYPMEMRSGLLPEASGYSDLFRVPRRMQDMRNVMLQNGDTANKIWVTEIGDRGVPRTVDASGDNEARQADFMRTVYWMLWRNRDFVETVLWFKYEDFAVPRNPKAVGPENWGVVRIIPRCPTDTSITTCDDYDFNGTVQVYKQSFATYANMASSGTGLETRKTYLPQVFK